jgi:hypothetical protein
VPVCLQVVLFHIYIIRFIQIMDHVRTDKRLVLWYNTITEQDLVMTGTLNFSRQEIYQNNIQKFNF